MLNIFAVLTVLKWRRKKVNDADVISDATIVDEDNVNQKKPKKQFSFFNRQQNNNIVVEYEDIEVDKSEVFYDGQLLDIAVKKKIIKKKGNWYLYGDEKLGYGKEKAKFFLLENPIIANEITSASLTFFLLHFKTVKTAKILSMIINKYAKKYDISTYILF